MQTFESNFLLSSMGVKVSGHLVTSTLLISVAVLEDAGRYSCTLPVFGNKKFPRARVMVHIIYGKNVPIVLYHTHKMHQGTSWLFRQQQTLYRNTAGMGNCFKLLLHHTCGLNYFSISEKELILFFFCLSSFIFPPGDVKIK